MHSAYKIFDAHCDTLGSSGTAPLSQSTNHFSLEGAMEYKDYVQVTAAFNDSSIYKNPYMRTLELIERYHMAKERTGIVQVLECTDFSKNGVKTILGIEGGEALEGSVERLFEFYELGVRIIGLTWNTPNDLCGTNTQDGIGDGLTEKGRQILCQMNKLGIVADVSHMSEKGFYDVAECSIKPFVASHSNSKALCPHSRNLTDDQFLTLCRCGGVTGINLYPEFLGDNASVDTVVQHIEHFMALGGEDHIGIGADFDGVDALPEGIAGCRDLYKIFDRLLSLGYSDSIIEKISYNNFYRVFCKNMK